MGDAEIDAAAELETPGGGGGLGQEQQPLARRLEPGGGVVELVFDVVRGGAEPEVVGGAIEVQQELLLPADQGELSGWRRPRGELGHEVSSRAIAVES